ncbi:MAG: endonuclease MutS2 [Chloroflexi bacterium]|nr:endonuclease MutS2 [Chloroflexota bacterium]
MRALLRRHTSFAASSALADGLMPSIDLEEILREQDTVAEARLLFESRPGTGVRAAHDIRPYVRHATLAGVLQPWQLLEIATTISAGRSIRALLLREEFRAPNLVAHAERIADLSPLENAIRRAMDDERAILDSASARLYALRSQVRLAHERLLRRLNEMMAIPNVREALQEVVVTMRSGRYVLPVKADFRGRVPGIVHDQSGSGVTLFVEPLSIVDLANQWRELGLQEQQEIEHILKQLSAQIAKAAAPLTHLVEALAALDLAFARAKLAQEMRAERPQVDPIPDRSHPREVVSLRQARHPLLHGDVVPIDIELGREFDTLLISGPNTGGKTVALKTVGLLALMAQAGLQIPAAPGSRVSAFHGVYADIGDEQSIEQSLSTFSSHVSRIVEILDSADSASLVLLDEIGAGTDPQEGSALGRALLAHLAQARIYTVATTHSSELKIFASHTARIENASVQFDVETLRPTYHLLLGVPGLSNALTIAERLGMPREIIEAAREALEPSERRADELLGDIHEQLGQVRVERATALRSRREAERVEQELQARLAAVEQERQVILRNAEREGAAMVSDLQRELETLRRELRGAAEERKTISAIEERLAVTWAEQQKARRSSRPSEALSPRVGEAVTVEPLGVVGIVRAIPDASDAIEVDVGGMRIRVAARDLRPAPPAAVPRAERTSPDPRYTHEIHPASERSPAPDTELDLRGLTAEEARARLDQYLSEAYMRGLHSVRVIHGKGAGVLREVVRDLISDHALVQGHKLAEPRHGGDGATEIELASRI